MKNLWTAVSVLVAAAIITVIVALYLVSRLTWTAEQFFSLIKKNDMQAASISLSEDFLASTPRAELEAFLRNNSLDKYKGASWDEHSVSVKVVELDGSVKTTDGMAVPLTIEFIKENGKWKILSIRKAVSGAVHQNTPQVTPQDTLQDVTQDDITQAERQNAPGDDALRQMTDTAFWEFAMAVNKKDFTDFYNNLSELWKSQITIEKLKETFKPFVDGNVDLTMVKGHMPTFSKKPEIGSDGELSLEGYYPVKPAVYFRLTFLYEYPAWKLAGISVQY